LTNTNNILFELQGVTKTYGGTIALDNVSLQVKSGQVTSIYGPNGAGKSTLVKILCGVEKVFRGNVLFNGEKLSFSGYGDALKAGISYLPQDFGLIPNLLGWENISIPHNQLNKRVWYTDGESSLTQNIENKVDFDISYFDQKVENLTTYQKQIIAIYKALSFNSTVYIFDESTTNLNSKDFQKFASLLNDLKGRGITILFISHNLEEVFDVSDEIIVLRNGELILQESIEDANKKEITNLFVSDGEAPQQDEIHISTAQSYHIEGKNIDGVELDFNMKKGEVASIETGDTSLNQQIGYEIYDWLTQYSSHRVGIIPGNRNTEGIFSNLSVKDNLIANALQHKGKVVIEDRQMESLNSIAEKLELKYNNWDQSITDLSGGNQQKIVFGRWMIADFDILILIEPTSGIDLKSKAIIHNTILEMARNGKSFILITSDEGEKLKLGAKNIRVKQLC
jgi:ABC-type sugar transport system ATPase subunit